jgi:hypothetical protein
MEDYIVMSSYSEDTGNYSVAEKVWKVIRKVVQSRSTDGINFQTREFAVMAYDKDFDKAHKTAMDALMNKLQPTYFNLFAIDNDPEIKETLTKKED